MNKQHPHAELLRAIADGDDVSEYQCAVTGLHDADWLHPKAYIATIVMNPNDAVSAGLAPATPAMHEAFMNNTGDRDKYPNPLDALARMAPNVSTQAQPKATANRSDGD